MQIDWILKELSKVIKDDECMEAVKMIFEEWEQQEKENRLVSQKNGILEAKEKGIAFGRPKLQVPDNFGDICEQYFSGMLTAASGAKLCKMGVSTFYRRVQDYRDLNQGNAQRQEYEE